MIKKELKELLQKHDSEIFSDELVESVTDLIQVSIDTEVNERVEVIQTAKEKEIEDLKESIEIKSKVYGENEIKENEKLVNTMTKWLDELKSELFESNVIDYENVAIVNEAIQIHKNNKQLAEKYLIDIEGLEENMEDKNKLKEVLKKE